MCVGMPASPPERKDGMPTGSDSGLLSALDEGRLAWDLDGRDCWGGFIAVLGDLEASWLPTGSQKGTPVQQQLNLPSQLVSLTLPLALDSPFSQDVTPHSLAPSPFSSPACSDAVPRHGCPDPHNTQRPPTPPSFRFPLLFLPFRLLYLPHWPLPPTHTHYPFLLSRPRLPYDPARKTPRRPHLCPGRSQNQSRLR